MFDGFSYTESLDSIHLNYDVGIVCQVVVRNAYQSCLVFQFPLNEVGFVSDLFKLLDYIGRTLFLRSISWAMF